MVSPVVIERYETDALISLFKPGQLVPVPRLFQEFAKIREAGARPPVTKMALGRALTRTSCEKVVLSKWRGRRGRQKVSDTHCWRMPGGRLATDEDELVVSVLRPMLDSDGVNYIPYDRVWGDYEEAARRGGWAHPLKRPGLTRWLGHHGFISQDYRKRRCWVVSRAQLDRISPPLVLDQETGAYVPKPPRPVVVGWAPFTMHEKAPKPSEPVEVDDRWVSVEEIEERLQS